MRSEKMRHRAPRVAALLFVPLAYPLTLIPSQVVWTLVNLAALLWFVAMSIRLVRPAIDRRSLLLASAVLSLPVLLLDPVFLTVGLGQVNLVLACFVLWDLAAAPAEGRRLPLGIATGVAAAIKLTPLVFIPYLLLTGRGRGARNCVATFAVCGALAFAISPTSSWVYWTRDVFDAQRAGGLLYVSDQNLSSALQRFHHGSVPDAVLWPLLAVVAVLGTALAVWAQRRSSEMLGVLVCASTGLLVSPVTWTHHLVWIVPAIAWLAAAPDRPRRGMAWATGAALLFWASPIWWVPRSWRPSGALVELRETGWQLLAGNSFLLAIAAFLAGVAVMLSLRRRAPAPFPTASVGGG